jgi:hypothetical protein
MGEQTTIDGETTGIDRATIFYRQVQSQTRTVDPAKEPIDSSELDDVNQLLRKIQADKLEYPIPIADSKMSELPTDRVTRILSGELDEHHVTDLLSLFCDSLEGRQRAEDKYAMLVYFGDSFLLAHVRAEQGISISQDEGQIELIRRFLDVDNILSAAYFELKNGEIHFSHFTDTGSSSFRDFLGVSERKYHYQKKHIQIVCRYQGQAELEMKFEFTNEELENRWLIEGSIELDNDSIVLNDGSSHTIKQVRWGNDTYQFLSTFKSDFKEYSYSLDGVRERYRRLTSNPSGSDTTVYSVSRAEDHRRRVKLIDDDGSAEYRDKADPPDSLFVIFAEPNIHLNGKFAEDILSDLLNGVECSIYHPCSEPAADELVVGNVSFLNIDKKSVSPEYKQFLHNVYDHVKNQTGETISRLMLSIFLEMVSREASPRFQSGLHQLININSGNQQNNDVVSTNENESAGLIEYKNKTDLESSDNPANTIADHIESERGKGHREKVFLWGITEQSRELDGFSTQSWNDDRIESIRSFAKEELNNRGIDYEEFLLRSIELSSEGDRWIIYGMIY